MNSPYPSVPALARQLLALEASRPAATHLPELAALRVLEKLRNSLSRFAGPEGFTALLRRALALARADVPALKTVTLDPDGRLVGLEALAEGDDGPSAAATIAITTYLLALLTTFVGEPLMLRLVREAWSDAALGD